MESLNVYLIAISTILTLCFLKLTLSGGKSKSRKNLPPGPWTLPIIGSLHHIISVLPHHRMMELSRRYGPLMLLNLGEVPTLVVSSAEGAALVMKAHDPAFADRSSSLTMDILGCIGKGIILTPYGERWSMMRKVCILELLSSKQVKRMEGIRAAEVSNLLHYITATASTGDTINISKKLTALSNDVVSLAVFGAKFKQQEAYLRELQEAMALLDGFCLVDIFPSSRLVRWFTNGERSAKRCHSRMEGLMIGIMEGRKAAQASGGSACSTDDEDLLDVLLRLQEGESLAFHLTTESVCAILFDIFTAATETTGSILAWAMSELISHPETMAKAQLEIRKVLGEDRSVITNGDIAELHYMRMIIKEVLRLHPPIPLVPRKCRSDCNVMGYDILSGTNVYINLHAISRDPKYWERPEEFNPERFNNKMDYNGTYSEFTPFGTGRRQCPGIQFTSALMEIILANLLYHFDWLLPEADTPTSIDMSEKFTFTVSRKYDLKVKAIPYMGFQAMSSK